MDRLLGDVAVLHSPFFGSGKLEYYLAARRPALEARGVDAFEPVANLHRCYLRQDPVFLRSLLRLVGLKVDRRFYFRRLLPGSQRGRAGRRAACSYVLLRNSFSGKWGSFAQQRPLALSSVRRLQRPPINVTVRRQDALAYLRALPSQARHCIYADPPYIFPGRSMNYYGTRGRGHDMAFHSELRYSDFGMERGRNSDFDLVAELYAGIDQKLVGACFQFQGQKPYSVDFSGEIGGLVLRWTFRPKPRSWFRFSKSFCALFGPKETSSAGWNSPVFRAESGILSKVTVWSLLSTENERNLRLRHPTCRPTRKNELFGLDRFERFLHQNRSRTER